MLRAGRAGPGPSSSVPLAASATLASLSVCKSHLIGQGGWRWSGPLQPGPAGADPQLQNSDLDTETTAQISPQSTLPRPNLIFQDRLESTGQFSAFKGEKKTTTKRKQKNKTREKNSRRIPREPGNGRPNAKITQQLKKYWDSINFTKKRSKLTTELVTTLWSFLQPSFILMLLLYD